MKLIINLGQRALAFSEALGRSGLLLFRIIMLKPRLRRFLPLLVEQIYVLGILSVLIIVVSGIFMGMVLSLQGYNVLARFGSVQQLGQLVALSVLRELGPVIAALLFAGRAGSALAAEIGLMKSTEQLASMEMMAVDPIWRIIAPRFWAGVLSLPLLTAIFCAVAIIGSYAISTGWLGIDGGQFWSNMQAAVSFRIDVLNGIIKSLFFGVTTTWVSVYQGYYVIPTAEGISRATTKTVVYSSLLILGLDFILTSFMLGAW